MTNTQTPTDRNETIRTIKANLKRRSGKAWSVRGGRGTAWGWITISSPPARSADQWGSMTDAERAELADLLGLERVHHQGVSIPAQHDYRRFYLAASAGETPDVTPTPQWD